MALDGERRCRARKKRTEENHPRPKSRGDSVYADGFDAAHILAGGDEPLDHAIGNEQTGSAAHQRQDEDLREVLPKQAPTTRSEEHSLNSSHTVISYAVFCLKKKRRREGGDRDVVVVPKGEPRSTLVWESLGDV